MSSHRRSIWSVDLIQALTCLIAVLAIDAFIVWQIIRELRTP